MTNDLQDLRNTSVKIQETFQQTIQGEGYWSGTLVDFIRLWGCPIGCHFCDTGYAADPQDPLEIPGIFELKVGALVDQTKSDRVVISGGEPTINKSVWVLIEALKQSGKIVHIETAGSKWHRELANCWITLSPKTHLNTKAVVDPQFWQRANEFKLVIVDGTELAFYKDIIDTLSPECMIYLQPEWSVRGKAIPIILELMIEFPRARMSLQTHKYARLS